MRGLLAGAAALFIGACAGGAVPGIMLRAEPAIAATSPHILAAVGDARRPEADTARDVLRHPADIMAFAQVQAGQRIADVGPGGGFYTRLFSVAVGEQGRVFAIDRPNAPDRPPRAILAVAPLYPNVSVIQQGYQNWSTPEPLDTIFVSQIYHDFHLPALNLDVPAINRMLFAALKPGGALVIIDHAAVDGSDLTVTDTLHRIDPETVKADFKAAGFVLEGESAALRVPEDDRSKLVFDAALRGKTDRFVYRFRKPR